jgi:hypothetical protein
VSTVGGELYVNAGGIWPSRIDTFSDNKIKSQGIYGLKGGVFFGDSAELEKEVSDISIISSPAGARTLWT